jgi:hypothetical protein
MVCIREIMNSKILILTIIIGIVISAIAYFSISELYFTQSVIDQDLDTESGRVIVKSLADGISTADTP